MILLIDNYDSFSYNLVQAIGAIIPKQQNIKVVRNDEITVEDIAALHPSHIIISPGPGKPVDAGICEQVIKAYEGIYPMLGVCLGHQAICEVYGATITYASQLMHGKQSEIRLKQGYAIFDGIGDTAIVARYHSLVAKKETMPEALEIIATTKEGTIMAVKHKEYAIYGLQFHPESVLTPLGNEILANFLGIC